VRVVCILRAERADSSTPPAHQGRGVLVKAGLAPRRSEATERRKRTVSQEPQAIGFLKVSQSRAVKN
jgi:hypothetical protein